MTGDGSQPESPLENAAEHANLGLPLPSDTRARFAKAVVERVARMFTSHQVAFNHAAMEVLGDQQQRIDTLTQRVDDVLNRIDALRADFERVTEEIRQDQRRELGRWRSDHALVERMLHEVREGRVSRDVAATFSAEDDQDPGASDQLYEDFEDLHRGSDELVRNRLSSYVPDLRNVATLGRVLDIGTGRGEFLDVMAQAGIDAYGIDTNAAAVERSRAAGFEVVHTDALIHLAEQPEASLAAITAFHLVEHLPFESVVALVDHAVRVLRPGGLLIIETPNPSNLVVGASSFYLDPTHRRPWPPPLLHFTLWARGFDPIEVRYMNPPHERLELPQEVGEQREHWQGIVDRLNELLFAPNDYCVIGHRVGPEA
jgi:SAM-dependent methyltransferase